MHIVVLIKAVPVVGTERLEEGYRTQRGQLEANGNDEYLLEKALKLTEAHGGEVSLLTVGPGPAIDGLRKALAMGATRAYHVVDPALAGSCSGPRSMSWSQRCGRLTFDLVFSGADTSDGLGGVVGAAVAARLGLPYLSYAADIVPAPDAASVTVQRLAPDGHDVLEAAMPAMVMGTQVLGEPRYPTLRGIMAARTREVVTWSLADLGVDAAASGASAATTRVLGRRAAAAARRRRRSSARPRTADAVHRWSTSWPRGGSSDGRHLGHRRGGGRCRDAPDAGAGDARARAGGQRRASPPPRSWWVRGLERPQPRVAAHGPDVIVVQPSRQLNVGRGRPGGAGRGRGGRRCWCRSSSSAPRTWLLIGATPDGKDLAGALIGLTELPILVNGSGVTWADGGPDVEMSTFGGRW